MKSIEHTKYNWILQTHYLVYVPEPYPAYKRGFVAAFVCVEDAAALIASLYSEVFATIRDLDGNVLWMEGIDGKAAHSYDEVVNIVQHREKLYQAGKGK